jgi:ribosome-binding factor A
VAEQVRQVVAGFLHEEARDPRIGFVTVTDVTITGDLQHATIHYVVHGDAAAQATTQQGLNAAVAAVRRRLGQELKLRVVPEVHFVLDKGREHAAQIEKLLAGLERPADSE